MKEHGICAKCKKSVGCPYADDRITGCKNFVLEPELKLTSKEWLRQCNTEQLAEYLASTFDLCGAGCHHCFLANVCLTKAKNGNCLTQEQMIVEWLKQPHTEGSTK